MRTDIESLVSVVIPVYNRRELIRRAIASVLSQRLPPRVTVEIVVVDDGSSDGTREDLRLLAREDARVVVVERSHCGFPGAVRNEGVRHARGSYIAFLDSDDVWLPEKVSSQLGVLRARPFRWCHTRERWIRDGRVLSQRKFRHRREGDILVDALNKCIVGPSTVMMERDLFEEVGGFDERIEVAEDYQLWLRTLAIAPIAYLDEELIEKHAGEWAQLSRKYGEIERFHIAALRELVEARFFERTRGIEVQRNAQGVLANKLTIYAAGARKRGRDYQAVQLENEARMLRGVL